MISQGLEDSRLFYFKEYLEKRCQFSLKPGDFIKISTSFSVYYYGTDSKRHSFPTEMIFLSWFPDFSTVKTISASDRKALVILTEQIFPEEKME